MTATTVLAWVNACAVLVAGGLLVLVSLIPLAMADDSPSSGPLLSYGVVQLVVLACLVASAAVGHRVARRATGSSGWTGLGFALGGWGAWVGALIVSYGLAYLLVAIDSALSS